MRSRAWLAQASTAFVLLTSAGGLAQTMPAEQRLKRLLTDFLAAASHAPASAADKRVFNAFFADDVVYTRATGVLLGKSDIMRGLDHPEPSTAPPPTYGAEDIVVRRHGRTAIVAFRLVQKSGDSTNRFRNTATFLDRSGAWQVIAWQATRIEGAP